MGGFGNRGRPREAYRAVEEMGTLSNGNATDGGAGDNLVNRGLAGRARPQEWVSARVPTGRVEPMTAIGCGFEATRPSLDVTPDRGSPRVAPPHHRSSSPETLSGGRTGEILRRGGLEAALDVTMEGEDRVTQRVKVPFAGPPR